jgi:hypothetical protein
MLTAYFLLGGNKVFQFCHAVTGCTGAFFTGAVVRGARMIHIMTVCALTLVMFRNHAHHRSMMMMRHCGKRHQHECGNCYGQYGKFTFQPSFLYHYAAKVRKINGLCKKAHF